MNKFKLSEDGTYFVPKEPIYVRLKFLPDNLEKITIYSGNDEVIATIYEDRIEVEGDDNAHVALREKQRDIDFLKDEKACLIQKQAFENDIDQIIQSLKRSKEIKFNINDKLSSSLKDLQKNVDQLSLQNLHSDLHEDQ